MLELLYGAPSKLHHSTGGQRMCSEQVGCSVHWLSPLASKEQGISRDLK